MPLPAADNQDPLRNHNKHLPVNGVKTPRPRPSSPSPAAAAEANANNNAAATSSDSDEPAPQAAEDEAGDVVGVSMSRAQTRMKARSTPAEEKNRIMERDGGYFAVPNLVHSDGLYLSDITAEPESVEEKSPSRSSTTIPDRSPQQQQQRPRHRKQDSEPVQAVRSQGKEVTYSDDTRLPKDNGGSRTSFTRSILGNLPKRPRALSGDAIANLNFRKFLPDLGSLTRRSSLSFRSNSSAQNTRPRSQIIAKPPPSAGLAPQQRITELPPPEAIVSQRRKSESNMNGGVDSAGDEPISELQSLRNSTAAKHSFTRRPSAGGPGAPPLLRRTSSDHSLYLRASSTVSSLDHRPQFEHIHTQVNSRFKAIKDSLQDSSSRLLSMPSFNLHDIRADWGYKPFFQDVSHRKDHEYSVEADSSSSAHEEHARQQRANSQYNTYPVLTEAMKELTGDVVVMGGYRGSILRSAKPPHRQLWVPMKVGLNLRKVDLEVGFNPEDEETMEERVIPSGILSHVGPVDICRRLIKRLQKCDNALKGDLRVQDFGYDWRLSPHLLSQKLIKHLEGLPCNAPDVPREKRGAYVIAHSLGGLIARHAVNQRPELFAGVVYAGVPQHCVNILGPLRNGDEVLLSSRVLTAQVNFSFRTSFALLPEDGHCFIDKRTKEEYPVDFFSPQAWDEYRLSPCINFALPPTGRNLMDNLPLLAKRLSMRNGSFPEEPDSAQEYQSDMSSSTDMLQQQQSQQLSQPQQPHSRPPSQAYETHQPVLTPSIHHHPPRYAAANPQHDHQNKPSAMKPALGGLVGPTAHPRGAAQPKTAATTNIPRGLAMSYLERTLADVRRFKEELVYKESHQTENRYPPFSVIFGKSVPTVYGARVESREQIKRQDAYDDLAFAAGDGVCLASAAMLPPGYRVIKDGMVKTDRGHVGLMGDLEGMGQCLLALVRGRKMGVGLGVPESKEKVEDTYMPNDSNTTPVPEAEAGTEHGNEGEAEAEHKTTEGTATWFNDRVTIY
ncbi:hypothetical protein SI65_07616 [Aspergillus cristatus]|uniref:Uncharacterized protein n=1 Tax=Aspergillus cristatus TaxID=573508 RepID=A0A1E3B8E7_ASPCR|nr:hypothetical protein SI65_07616 [Aspergillus cristatus]